ncbi:MAG: hypothetical protein WCC36_10095 [Gammaproteobacteria bacterium]
MKFHQLSVGQRFQSDGVNYIKTSPMIASDAHTGWQKFMARSAPVKVIEQTPARSVSVQRALEPESVHSALGLYHTRCVQCLENAVPGMDAETLEMMKQELEAAKRACLRTLFDN